jgi:hypothetical protein
VAGCELDEETSISGRDRDISIHHTALGLTRPAVRDILRAAFPLSSAAPSWRGGHLKGGLIFTLRVAHRSRRTTCASFSLKFDMPYVFVPIIVVALPKS